MAVHKTKVYRLPDEPAQSRLAKPAIPAFRLPPKLSRILGQNSEVPVVSHTAVDGAGLTAAQEHGRKARDPVLKQSQSISLAVAPPAGGLQIAAQGNALLYADSSNGTDRLNVQYQRSTGDNSQPNRVMVPGRFRREAAFVNLVVTWNVVAGATAVLEIYDDPDGVMFVQN